MHCISCVPVSAFIWCRPEFYRNEWRDRAGVWHRGFLRPICWRLISTRTRWCPEHSDGWIWGRPRLSTTVRGSSTEESVLSDRHRWTSTGSPATSWSSPAVTTPTSAPTRTGHSRPAKLGACGSDFLRSSAAMKDAKESSVGDVCSLVVSGIWARQYTVRPHRMHRLNAVCCYTRRTFRGPCVFVCWAHPRALQKRLNQSRRSLGAEEEFQQMSKNSCTRLQGNSLRVQWQGCILGHRTK